MIVTPRVAKHSVFVWSPARILPDTRLVAIARDDDTAMGILHSRVHEAWSLRLGGRHGVGNDPQYTPTLRFETFPFPQGLTPNIAANEYAGDPRTIAIAAAAKRLDELRSAWLNPPDLIDVIPEVMPGYPDRIMPKDEKAATELRKRTLTNLYNATPMAGRCTPRHRPRGGRSLRLASGNGRRGYARKASRTEFCPWRARPGHSG
jgi:type II restriction/modification system DNA methylase subunit YeeA